jgi:hypothetical protein
MRIDPGICRKSMAFPHDDFVPESRSQGWRLPKEIEMEKSNAGEDEMPRRGN